MTKLRMVMVGVAAAVLAIAPATAAPRPARADRSARKDKAGAGARKVRATGGGRLPTEIPAVHIALESWPDTMAREVKPTEEQQGRLKEKVQAAQEALAAWDKQNKDKLAAAEEELDKARRAYKADEVTPALQKVKELKSAREKLQAEKEADILSVLTSDQRDRWEGCKLYLGLVAAFMQVDLTDAQRETLRLLADQAAAEIRKAETDDAKAAARKKLLDGAIAGVLTAPQRRQLAGEASPAAGKRDKAQRPGKARPARKARLDSTGR